jgi:4-diphosphocytidyl-2-C-methyl-D-erythritol kinase
MSAPQSTFVSAHAKINLTLDILGKRDDGYHALASVMQTLALHDTLLVSVNMGGAITVHCDDPSLSGDDNLARRAALLLKGEIGDERLGATIELRKEVPIQAGLGGGSSDAAAVLNTLNAQWNAGYTVAELQSHGALLGSDVAFFIRGGTALIEGRGEHVTSLPDVEPLWILLAKPRVGLSTAVVFGQLAPRGYSDGTATRQLAQFISSGQPIELNGLYNALEPGVLSAFQEVAATRDTLLAAGAPVVRMSGSGPTFFAPFRELSQARAVLDKMLETPYDVWLTHTIPSIGSYSMLPIR